MSRVRRIFATLKDLRWQQWWFRVWHPLKRLAYRPPVLKKEESNAARTFPVRHFLSIPPPYAASPAERTYAFLNLNKSFSDATDWNFTGYGLLWAFHLNYFDWLGDERLSRKERLDALKEYAAQRTSLKVGLHSYPASVRLINAIRFLEQEERSETLLQLLWEDACRVAHFPELHLMGNHFLENAFALLYAAHFFQEIKFYKKSRRWLQQQLAEQVLPDGGHFERSPAYHAHVLLRLLQCIELLQRSYRFKDEALISLLKEKAAAMLSWLESFALDKETMPHFGDSNPEMMPELPVIWQLAATCGVTSHMSNLQESGYRKMQAGGFTLWFNGGSASPAYLPGHAHADPLSIVLYHHQSPVLMGAGVSTYENNARRHWERSTAAHNTPVVNGQNASDTWSAFRMGRKAQVKMREDKPDCFLAVHNGYQHLGCTVSCRINKLAHNSGLQVVYSLEKRGAPATGTLFLHLPPDTRPEHFNSQIFEIGRIKFEINTNGTVSLQPYAFAAGFHHLIPSFRIKIDFKERIVLVITTQEVNGD